jgi:hypothetical protein
MVEGFIFVSYLVGTVFGYYWGKSRGHNQGIEATIDSLIEKGYLKFKGNKHNPEILRHDEEY